MSFRVSGKNIDIGEALRTRVSSRVAEAVDKYFHGGYSGHVTVGKEAFGFRTECVVHLDSGIVLQSDAMAGDAYSQRRSGGGAHREAAAPLQAAAQGSPRGARQRPPC